MNGRPVIRWVLTLLCVAVVALLLVILTIEPVTLRDLDLARIRFISIAPGSRAAQQQPTIPEGGLVAQEEEGDGGWAWYQAEAREWRGVVEQVTRSLAASADFCFRFPARPSAPIKKLLAVHSGLPRLSDVRRCSNTVVLYLGGGWSGICSQYPSSNQWEGHCGNGAGVAWTLRQAWRARLPCPIVGFNFDGDRMSTFNCGQQDDNKLIGYVYRRVERRYPGAKIIAIGSCIGGLRIVNWLATIVAAGLAVPASLAGIVLESPLPSLREYAGRITDNEKLQEFCYGFMALAPNYDPFLDPLYLHAASIDGGPPQTLVGAHIPVLVSVLGSDAVSNATNLGPMLARIPHAQVIVHHRKRVGTHPIYHGRVILLPEHQAALRAFVATIANSKPTKAHDP